MYRNDLKGYWMHTCELFRQAILGWHEGAAINESWSFSREGGTRVFCLSDGMEGANPAIISHRGNHSLRLKEDGAREGDTGLR